jgi:hypothetical protein
VAYVPSASTLVELLLARWRQGSKGSSERARLSTVGTAGGGAGDEIAAISMWSWIPNIVIFCNIFCSIWLFHVNRLHLFLHSVLIYAFIVQLGL